MNAALRLRINCIVTGKLISIFDYAAVGSGRIPDYVLKDEKLVAQLPALFRTVTRARAHERRKYSLTGACFEAFAWIKKL